MSYFTWKLMLVSNILWVIVVINKNTMQCFFGFAVTKSSQLFSQDDPHTRLSCSSKWPNLFLDGIIKFYVQPGLPIYQKRWTKRSQAISKRLHFTQTQIFYQGKYLNNYRVCSLNYNSNIHESHFEHFQFFSIQ